MTKDCIFSDEEFFNLRFEEHVNKLIKCPEIFLALRITSFYLFLRAFSFFLFLICTMRFLSKDLNVNRITSDEKFY